MGPLGTLGKRFGQLYNQPITSVSGVICIIYPNNSVNASPSYGDPASYCEIRPSGNLSPVAIDSPNKQAMLSNFYTSKLGSFVPTGSTTRYIVTVDTNIFVAGAASDHTLRVWRSTDSGATWSEQDGANRKAIKYQPGAAPLNGGAVIRCVFDGATIHIAYLQQEAASGAQALIEIVTFSTSSNTYGSVITGGPTTLNYSGQQFTAGFTGFAFDLRGSDYIVHYQGTKENVGGNKDRVYRAIYTGGAWGAGSAVTGQAGLAYHFAVACTVAGSSSRIHVFMRKVADPTVLNDLTHITLKSDNTYDAGGIQTVVGLQTDAGGAFDEGQISTGINLNGEIIVPFMAAGTASQEPVKVITATSADAPTWSVQVVYAGGTSSPSQGTTRPSIGIGAIGSTPYVIWGDNSVAASEKIVQSTRVAGVWGAHTTAFTIGHFIDALTVTHFGTALEITTTALAEGDVGLPYSETLEATGDGDWEITAGAAALAAIGLTLSAGGILSGTPTASGTFTLTVEITDSDGNTDTQDLTLVINPVSNHWTPGNPGEDGWHIEEDEGRDGGRAACRTADGVNPMADLISSPKVTVEAGQIYYLEAFGIADPGTSGQLEIGMKFYNASGLFQGETFVSLGSAPTVYTRWSTTITVPSGAVQAEFVVRVEAHLAGKWCVDDAWWTRLDANWKLSSVKHWASDYAAYR